MTFYDLVRRYVTVNKCLGCGEILGFEDSEDAFCPSCRLSWKAALTVGCEECFHPALECTCMPKSLSKAGALCLRKQFFYKSEDSRSPEMSVIYWLKYKNSRRIVNFVARSVSVSVREEIALLGYGDNPDMFIVCGVPRGKWSKNKYGYDQSALVAKRIGRILGIKYAPLLRSTFGGKIQKSLDQKQRLENAKAHIRLSSKADVEGKYVVIFDDMVTSGASMSVCVELLRLAGARGVLCFSLASKQKM